MCIEFLPAVCFHTMRMSGVHAGQKRVSDPLELQTVVSLHIEDELNPEPLQEQKVVLTSQPSL